MHLLTCIVWNSHQSWLHCYFYNSGFRVGHLCKDKIPYQGATTISILATTLSPWPLSIPFPSHCTAFRVPKPLQNSAGHLPPRFHLGKVPMSRICSQAAWCNEEPKRSGFGYYQLSGLGQVPKFFLMIVM